MNIVGTNWACVTRCRSISPSASSGFQCSMTTTVPPVRCVASEKRSGAAWYSGAVDR